MKRVHSLAPYEFRGRTLPKGESEFDFDALNSDDKKFFEGLVKAEIVRVLPDAPKEPEKGESNSDDKKGGDASPADDKAQGGSEAPLGPPKKKHL